MSARPLLRRFASIATVTAAVLVLSSCAGSASTDRADGGELVWAIEGANLDSGHMDPQTSQLDVSSMVQRNVLDSLVFQKADGSFGPWLAKSWKVSDDGRQYTFALRDDVTFSDGTAFNAEAVKVYFERIMNPETASAQAAGMLGGDNYAGTEVVDEHTVKVSFTQPYAPFLQAASTALLGFWSPTAMREHGDDLKAGSPEANVGTGPFVMTEYTPKQEIVYTRNADYAWGPDGAGAPKLQTLRVQIVPEPSVRTGMVNAGEAQVASQVPPTAVSEFDKDVTVAAKSYPGLPYSLYLNEKFGVFADQKVRQAFERAINVDGAVKSIFDGQFQRAWSVLGPTTPDYDAALEGSWPFSAAAANALLDQAGWTARDAEGYRTKNGTRLAATWIAWTPVSDENAALANAIQSDLKQVGFEVKREVLEPGAYNEKYGPKAFDITDWGFSGVDADLLRSHLGTNGFQNASQVSDPAVDALLKTGAESTDPAARTAAYTALQQWNAEHVAIVPLYVPALITAARPDVTGLAYDLYGRPLFGAVALK